MTPVEWLSSWLRRALGPFKPRRSERDMEEEMRNHVALEADWLEEKGVASADAMRRALASFGGVARHKEDARDAWPLRWAERVWSDVRFALRSLRRTPSFTIAAVIALALGMGASSVVFNAVDAVAFRPLAVRDPEQLVAIFGTRGEARLLPFSYPAFKHLRERSLAFADIAAVNEGSVNVFEGGEPTAVWSARVSDNYFAMLGVTPAAGVLFQPGDLRKPYVVLSHAYWTARYGGSPAAIGRTIIVNGAPFTIVGIAPKQFTGTRLFTYNADVWLMVSDGLDDHAAARLLLIGRLRDGVTSEQARQDAGAAAAFLGASFPDTYRGLGVELFSNRTPINPWLAPPGRIAWIGGMVLAGISLVLIIACTNVASLMLARGAGRRPEIAVRLSLGASAGRLVQQLLTESFVIAAIGGLVAVPMVRAGGRALLALTPPLEFASAWRPADASRSTAYAIAVTVGSALLFGVAPALHAARVNVRAGLNAAMPLALGMRRRVQLREVLVVAQVALSVVLLAAAGLFVRSLRQARLADPGFNRDGAVVFTVDPRALPGYDATRARELYRRMDARLSELPGVQVVSRAITVPLDGNSTTRHVFADGTPTTLDRAPAAEFNMVDPSYFRAIGTPLVAGREFVRADSVGAKDVAIVNDVLASRLWPGQSGIGKTIRLASPASAPLTVIGVARSSNYRAVGEPARPAVWRDLARSAPTRATVIVRVSGDAASAVRAIRQAMRELEPSLPLVGLARLSDRVEIAYSGMSTGAVGASAFGLLSLGLAASGLFGLVAYGVAQRRREIGIRVALGARPASVAWFVVRRSVMITAVGVIAGLTIVAAVPMGLGTLLYGVSPWDPATLTATALLFVSVAAIAALVPARRATRLDPARTLRVDN